MIKNTRILFTILCVASAFFLVAITFTPLVTPNGVYEPKLMGLPYTLWVGILITIGLVFLTFIATRIQQPKEEGLKE